MYGPRDHFDVERSHALGALVKKISDAKTNNKNSVRKFLEKVLGKVDKVRVALGICWVIFQNKSDLRTHFGTP